MSWRCGFVEAKFAGGEWWAENLEITVPISSMWSHTVLK